ncbi:hypothetical protein [Epibacterium ulvae]|uniref:hypothetical protein n=1 Tax=Epibacterium ulvae TaxID=1156985 RepID=UPI002491F4CD|nr:hypothetical protein [Epibacterium ulvae]
MSTAPIQRDVQIELMTTHQKRRQQTFEQIISKPALRAVLKARKLKQSTATAVVDEKQQKFG